MEMAIMYAEVASLHTPTFAQLERYGEDFRQLLVRSQFVLATDYLHSLRARTLVQRDFEAAFETFDAVVVPGVVCVAPRHDHLVAQIGSDELPLPDALTRTTSPFNLVGIPRVTVPSGLTRGGLPMAINVGAPPYAEAVCLRVAHAYQQVTEFHKVMPRVLRETAGVRGTGRQLGADHD
jgi:aspartyl-tRNA(Asn)/glutamyl-tRNA(Gln) amidotransferase subunit A